jgi:hypothetical protein
VAPKPRLIEKQFEKSAASLARRWLIEGHSDAK